jgi:hypothetical protein
MSEKYMAMGYMTMCMPIYRTEKHDIVCCLRTVSDIVIKHYVYADLDQHVTCTALWV